MFRRPKTYCVYIMGSFSGTLYIGMTSSLHKPVFQHKFHRMEGFTDKYQAERLLYWESFDEVVKAINREKQLKRWKRAKKIALIESLNPHWVDLAREWYPWMNGRASWPFILRPSTFCLSHRERSMNSAKRNSCGVEGSLSSRRSSQRAGERGLAGVSATKKPSSQKE